MKFLKLGLIILCISVIAATAYSADKTRVAVLDFAAKGVDDILAEAVVENLLTSLIDSGCFEVIERKQLEKVMNELNLQNSDDFNDDLREQLGNLYGVELVILGSVTKIGDNITINARGVEVTTGVGKFGKRVYTDSENDIPSLISLLVDYIAEATTGKPVHRDKEDFRREDNGRKSDMEEFRDYAKSETDELREREREKEREKEREREREDREERKSYSDDERFVIFNNTVPMDFERFSVWPFEIKGFNKEKNRFLSKIIILAEDNCADFKKVVITFDDMGDNVKVLDFGVDAGSGYYEIKTTDRKGRPRKFEDIVFKVKTGRCDGRQRARIIIYGIK